MVKQSIITHSDQCLHHAQEYYKQTFTWPTFEFTLRGRAAAQMCSKRKLIHAWQHRFRVNLPMAQANQFEFVQQIVPHEIAHLVVASIWGQSPGIKPHGKQWQAVMVGCFERPAILYHNFSVPKQSAQRSFEYQCGCRTMQLSTTRHNRAQAGTVYQCPACRQNLRLKAHLVCD